MQSKKWVTPAQKRIEKLGTYTDDSLRFMGAKRLETLLDFMIEFNKRERQNGEGARKTPSWWPNDHTLKNLEVQRANHPKLWIKFVRGIVAKGRDFCKKVPGARARPKRIKFKIATSKLLKFPKRDTKITKAKTKVVMSRIRKVNCVVKLEPIKDYTLALGNLSPVVRLTDVFKPVQPKPIAKDDFMCMLNLTTSDYKTVDKPRPTINTKYNNNVPFSSDVGKLLIKKDIYTLSQEMTARKTEKIEYYLKNDYAIAKEKSYEVAHNKKHRCDHTYNFPKRQNYQRKCKVMLPVLKPVKVCLKRLDVRRISGRNVVMLQDVRVVLERID